MKNKKFSLADNGRRLEVYDTELATIINRKLKFYSRGKHRFETHEEPVFRLSQIELNWFRTLNLSELSTIA